MSTTTRRHPTAAFAGLCLQVLLPSVALGQARVETTASPTAVVEIIHEEDPNEIRTNVAGMAAHHLCSGVYVVGRDLERTPERVFANDVQRFDVFNWQSDFEYRIDRETRTAHVWGDGVAAAAEYNGDQGCTILPAGLDDVTFEPVRVERWIPDASATPWPTGDVDAHHETPPADVDAARLEAALDWVMAQTEHNTRALVVVYEGKILGERYADGFTRHTPQISWSQGKSVASALVGAAMQAGHLDVTVDDRAPVPEWHEPGDPRREIRLRDLLRMSSGLDFQNWGLGRAESWTDGNEHFRIYFEGIDVYEHAIDQPMDIEPGERFRYRNSDPLTLNRIVRRAAEAAGEEWLTYPQRVLFDRIGARSYVLETDAWGNFIITGYDYGSAWDWARFGLLHLWDGVWPGPDGEDRVLPEGWVDFVRTPAPGDPSDGYGGLFWLNRGGALPRAPADTYFAAGFMGQYTAIIPSMDLVIVRLGPSPGNTNRFLSDIIGEVTDAIDRSHE
ncbi:MAG: beta-lactamase family protein [Gemmatimonadetes bacterium]|nr:beta-lactamase family protein [Gemmatimonadota bacterium]